MTGQLQWHSRRLFCLCEGMHSGYLGIWVIRCDFHFVRCGRSLSVHIRASGYAPSGTMSGQEQRIRLKCRFESEIHSVVITPNSSLAE